ncbi:SDR family oxidoreductase [Pseudooceanicola sediminis]|nr:SDR family oxidoreductase [Pseudooceanicola sediminis]|tara:strand:+ start:45426 stop:46658 length:1233 start_codon:yes stop_codon:yes gene_type:complete
MQEQRSKVALVTGGASGIGWAICARLARKGYRVALADVDRAKARTALGTLGSQHVDFHVDLTGKGQARLLPDRVMKAMGRLDLVINNAGMTDSSGRGIACLPQADFARLVDLNLVAPEQICKSACELLPEGGRIINLSSGAAYRPLALRGPYSATKAAVTALTAALDARIAQRGIRVSAVAPGYTLTPLVEELAAAGRVDLDQVAAGIPLGRIALPGDIASAVAFLASPGGAALGGQTLVVDGGGQLGTAPDTTWPQIGRHAQGATLLITDQRLNEIEADLRASALPTGLPLGCVIDARGLQRGEPAAAALTRLHALARACAGHAARSTDFSLLVVSAQDDTPAGHAATAATAMLVRTLALEWAPARIRVNALIWRGTPDETLGSLCRFLCSSEAALVTGQCLEGGPSPP